MTDKHLRQGIIDFVPIAQERAEAAVKLRRRLRKTVPKSLERNEVIEESIEGLVEIGAWLRPFVKALEWHEIPASEERRLTKAVAETLSERRQLRKMLRR